MIAIPDPDSPVPNTVDIAKVTKSRLETCSNCGGEGCRLVLLGGELCAHCKRSSRTTAKVKSGSATATAYSMNGFVDITPALDGGVLKASAPVQRGSMAVSEELGSQAEQEALMFAKAARGGEMASIAKPWPYPLVDGCPCGLHFVTRWAKVAVTGGGGGPNNSERGGGGALQVGGGDVVASTRDIVDERHVGGTDDPLDVVLGRGEVVVGIELAVRTMALGEKSVFLLRHDYAFGSRGDGFKVGSLHAPLEVELELVYVCAPLPLMPKGPEVEKRRKERQKRERLATAAATGPLDERLASCYDMRNQGNALFAAKDFEGAKSRYDSGFLDLVITTDEWEAGEDPAEDDEVEDGEREKKIKGLSRLDKRRVCEAKALLHVNRSLVNLKLGRLDAAKWDAERALDCDRIARQNDDTTVAVAGTAGRGNSAGTEVGSGSSSNSSSNNSNNGKSRNIGSSGNSGSVVAKAHHRKGLALLAMAKAELAKETIQKKRGTVDSANQQQDLAFSAGPVRGGGGAYWDVSKAQRLVGHATAAFEAAELALEGRRYHGKEGSLSPVVGAAQTATLGAAAAAEEEDVMTAFTDNCKSDELSAVERSKADACRVALRLAKSASEHAEAWRIVCRDKIMAGLEAENKNKGKVSDSNGKELAAIHMGSTISTLKGNIANDYSDMPELDDDDDDENDEEG